MRIGLVLHHIGDLVIVRHAAEVIYIGRLGRLRIKADVARRGGHRVVVGRLLVLRESGHQQSFARPLRERILLFKLAEFLRGVFEIIALQKDEALIIEVFGRDGRRDLGLVFFAAATEQIGDRIEEVGARALRRRQQQQREWRRQNPYGAKQNDHHSSLSRRSSAGGARKIST